MAYSFHCHSDQFHTGLDGVHAHTITASRHPAHGTAHNTAQCASHSSCPETSPETHSAVKHMQSRNGEELMPVKEYVPLLYSSRQFWEHFVRLFAKGPRGRIEHLLPVAEAVSNALSHPRISFPFFSLYFPWPDLLLPGVPFQIHFLAPSLCIRLPFRLRQNQMSAKLFYQPVSGFIHFILFYFHDSSARYVRTHSYLDTMLVLHLYFTLPGELTVGRSISQCHSDTGVVSNNYTLKWLQTQTKCIRSSTFPLLDSPKCLGALQYHQTQEEREAERE